MFRIPLREQPSEVIIQQEIVRVVRLACFGEYLQAIAQGLLQHRRGQGGRVCIAKNTPIDLMTNVDLVTPEHFRKDTLLTRLFCHITGTGGLNGLFLLSDNAPDFVQDRGHTFGSNLPDQDKHALMEYMKTF